MKFVLVFAFLSSFALVWGREAKDEDRFEEFMNGEYYLFNTVSLRFCMRIL
jgi:hypothetical protein